MDTLKSVLRVVGSERWFWALDRVWSRARSALDRAVRAAVQPTVQLYNRLRSLRPTRPQTVDSCNHPGDNPWANGWFLLSTLIQMLPPGGSVFGRLTSDLPLGCLQGGEVQRRGRPRSRSSRNGPFKNNYFAEIKSGSEEGSCLKLIDCCITQPSA